MKPALVQPSCRLDELPAGPGRRRRGARGRPREHEQRRGEPTTSTSAIPSVGSEPVPGRCSPRLDGAGRGHGASRDERAEAAGPARAPSTTQARGEHDHGGAHRPRRLDRACGARLARGGPSSTSPTTLTKQKTASAAVAASAASASAPAVPVADPAVGRDVQQRLQRQPLRGEAVQRRQAGDRHRADQERAARPRHPPQQPAEPVELERADRPLERAGAEEEQRLEDRVVERVQQRGGERERRPGVGAAGAQDQAGADPEHDDPDVLDRVEREQPLQVVLEERVDDAADAPTARRAPSTSTPNQSGSTPSQSTSTRTSA